MDYQRRTITQSTQTTNLADLLERVLDKGIVIAGDIKIKLVDVELLTIQIRLLIASVDKAREMGIDWWVTNPELSSKAGREHAAEVDALKQKIAKLEGEAAAPPAG